MSQIKNDILLLRDTDCCMGALKVPCSVCIEPAAVNDLLMLNIHLLNPVTMMKGEWSLPEGHSLSDMRILDGNSFSHETLHCKNNLQLVGEQSGLWSTSEKWTKTTMEDTTSRGHSTEKSVSGFDVMMIGIQS